ncbi:hypothetical protein L195_g034788 [Trifolium pratense]|uniref:Uncharacterized protein n=1 Tax=Trifolium pratense TaxID=57577 RepID=A0A2K3LJT8_TRIPR|nr:hypothetical protein L195_g034788 [Trifolium pratense]
MIKPSVEIYRSQGIWFASIRHRLLIRLSLYDCVWTALFERTFMPAACLGGCWYVDLGSVLAVDPFAILKPFLILVDAHSSFFCNLISRPYAGSLGCTRDEC